MDEESNNSIFVCIMASIFFSFFHQVHLATAPYTRPGEPIQAALSRTITQSLLVLFFFSHFFFVFNTSLYTISLLRYGTPIEHTVLVSSYSLFYFACLFYFHLSRLVSYQMIKNASAPYTVMRRHLKSHRQFAKAKLLSKNT